MPLIRRGQSLQGGGTAAAEPEASVGRTSLRSLALAIALGLLLLGFLLAASDRPAWASVPPTSMAKDGEDPAMWLPSTAQDAGPPGEPATPASQAGAADGHSPAACDVSTAPRTGTITLDETGVGAPCIVVSAGDLVTWVNLTAAPIVIQTADDEFATEDVSAVFSTVEVPALGQATVRVIHAGRIDYTAPDHPGLSGTILVLGRGAA